ncbi:MAG: hypothetical protein HY289_03455 [Planctomycetes bacterium]|nr:hypothetical protein [Planctomycetota bacterium]
MRRLHTLALLGVSILCPGCALIQDAHRNLCLAVTTPIETHRENARNRRWADEAWRQISGTQTYCNRSDDYASGFKDGYADYVFRGGDGEPPLIAPLRYRHLRYQNPQGFLAIENWFAGYRHGAHVAKETGARRWVTGPSGFASDASNEEPMLHAQSKKSDQPKATMSPILTTLPRFQPLEPSEASEPSELKLGFQAPAPEVVEPAPMPMGDVPIAREPIAPPALEPPMRLKITQIQAAPDEAATTLKARITGIQVAPAPRENPYVPTRIRITSVTPAEAKD